MELEDSRHGAHEGLVTLLDSIDEPSCGIHLLLDELRRIARLGVLRHRAVFAQHIAVLPADVQFGYITGVEHNEQFLVPFFDREVRDDGLPLGLVHIAGESIRGFLIQMYDLLYSVLELLVGAFQTLLDLIVPMFGERFEIVLEDRMRQTHRLRLRGFDLQVFKQAFLQVGRRDAGRVKLFDLLDDGFHLFVGHTQLFLEHQIIHQLFGRAPEVSVIVNITKYPLGDMPLRFGHVGQINLRFEFLDQTATTDDRHFASVFVRRTVLLMQHVTRRLIVRDVLLVIEIFVLQRIALTSFFVPVLRHVVIIELILHAVHPFVR